MKKTQNGFIVPVLLVVTAFLLASSVAYLYTQKKSENPPVVENALLPQATSTSLIKNETDPSIPATVMSSAVAIEKLKNATYHLTLPGKGSNSEVALKMVNGEVKFGNDPSQFTAICSFPTENPVVFGQSGDSAVVAIYCNYGASATDVFLVAFKNMSTTLTQTDVTNLGSYPDSKIKGSLRLSVKQITLESNGALSVTALVVPESLYSEAAAFQNNTEPYTVKYFLDAYGKIKVAELKNENSSQSSSSNSSVPED